MEHSFITYVLGIASLPLTFYIWKLYHNLVDVTYYGSMGRHIFKEVLACFIVAVLAVSAVGAVLQKIGIPVY